MRTDLYLHTSEKKIGSSGTYLFSLVVVVIVVVIVVASTISNGAITTQAKRSPVSRVVFVVFIVLVIVVASAIRVN